MSQAVQDVLRERSARSPRRQQTIAVTVAVLLHAIIVTAAFAVPRLTRKAPQPIEYVEVHVLPPQALGVERPAPRPQPKAPEPAPPPPEETLPPPEEKPAPKPEPKPEPEVAPKPEPKPETDRDRSPRQEPADDGPEGASSGAPGGTSRLGAQVLSPDGSAFPYDYYLEQMLTQIRRNWVRPPIEGVRTVVSFRVLSDGQITDVAVRAQSGSRSFDLAAVRALRNASPLPPLPASYRQESLTVNLIVR